MELYHRTAELTSQTLGLQPVCCSLPFSLVYEVATIFTTIFRATGDEIAIDAALGLYRATLVTLTQAVSPQRLSTLNGLAYALRIRFNRLRSPSDLEEAVVLSRQAVALSSSYPPSKQKSLWNLGASLRMTFDNLSNHTIDVLHEAISVLRQAVSDQYQHFHMATVDLADALISWSRQSRDENPLLEAISLLQLVYNAEDLEEGDRIYTAFILVYALKEKVSLGGAMSASILDEALTIGRASLTLEGDWQYHLVLMQAIANTLRDRCFHSGSISDSDESIDLLRKVARSDPAYCRRRLMVFRDLGQALWRRFQLSGSSKDVEETIEVFHTYHDLCLTDYDRASAYYSIAVALLERFEVYYASGDIEEAIEMAREAQHLSPHVGLRQACNEVLAVALIDRHCYVRRSCDDVDEAICFYRKLLAEGYRVWSMLASFGEALRLRYEHVSQDRTTLAEASEYHKQAMSMIQPGQWEEGHILSHMTQNALAAFTVEREPTAHEDAMHLFTQLMAHGSLTSKQRLYYCSTIVKRYAGVLPATSSLEILHWALSLLPRVAYLGLEIYAPDALSLAPYLSTTAAKYALETGKAAEAVEYIEVGRAIFWSKALQLRETSSEGLPDDIAHEFFELSRTLEGLSRVHSSELASVSEEHLSRRRMMANRHDELLQEIRAIPGFDDFLLPKSFQKLRLAAKTGFIVMLSPANIGYNAIILSSSSETPQVIHLPIVTTERLAVLSGRFNREIEWLRSRDAGETSDLIETGHLERLGMRKGRRESPVETLLAELWRNVVHPVIKALGLPSRRGDKDRARLFWCPTGRYVSIPLHAAGLPDGPCAADYAIQSYIPTISALLHAQRPVAVQSAVDTQQNILLVAQPSAPGHSPLPNTVHEICTVADIVGKAQLLGVDDPQTSTVGAISRALSSASIVHLACHGRQDKDALRSGFVMSDGVLTVDDLMRLKLPNASFAFLSACHAAAINPDNPPDEVLHLAATMLYSGFRSVIATMWSMNDADGPTVAREVYSEAFRDGQIDLSRVPYALDAAVQKLKEDGVPASRWATYIHMGI